MADWQIVSRRLGTHERLAAAFLLEMTRRDPDGTRVAAAVDVDQAAALAADTVLDPGVAWVEALGAFYDTDAVRRLLG